MSQVPIDAPDMTGDLAWLEKARLAMRRQAAEHLAEADRLDALYEAVTGNTCAAEEGSEVTE
jgi:hypothetical protein